MHTIFMNFSDHPVQWSRTTQGTSTASPEKLYALLADPTTWPSWNPGVRMIEVDGAFVVGAQATMVFPDGSRLPFSVTRLQPPTSYEDLTLIPDAGVMVRVSHELEPITGGTRITYRCDVAGPDAQVCEQVGEGACEDFPEVIAGVARAAENNR